MRPPWPRPRSAQLNLALEELLLDECLEAGEAAAYAWASWPSVVAGRLNRDGVDYSCVWARRLGVPVYRRASGGGAVLHGPGVLAVTIIVPSRGRTPVERVYESWAWLLAEAVGDAAGLEARVENEGDIVVEGYKVGGSAALVKPRGYLYHAILTVDEDISKVHLLTPPRRDRVERREVTPAKYRPLPLASLAPGTSRAGVLDALSRALASRGLRLARLHDAHAPCVARVASLAPARARERLRDPKWTPCTAKPSGPSQRPGGL